MAKATDAGGSCSQRHYAHRRQHDGGWFMQTLRATRADAKASILSYEPERQSEQELPRAEEAERRQAEEKLERVREER
jgi:hypothetical protein